MKRTTFLTAVGVAGGLIWGVLLLIGTAAAQTAPPSDQRTAIASAVTWLVNTHQNDDGGYSSFSTGAGQADSDVSGTADAILAIAAAGYNPAVPAPGKSSSPLAYLQQNGAAVAAYAGTDGSAAGKLVLALTAAGQDPRRFGSSAAPYNFVITLTNHLSPTGQFNVNTAFGQSLAMLALSAAGEAVPEAAVSWLIEQQAEDGSWDDGFGTASNTDATAMAVMALVASGSSAAADSLAAAANFLQEAQLPTGGWAYAPGLAESANSTALALQAAAALGQDFYTPGGPLDRGGNTPLAALLAWQSQTGAFQADFGNGRFDDFYTTVQAIPAAAGKPYPLPARYEAARRAVSCLATLQDPATGGWEQFAGAGINAAGTARAIQAIVAVGDDPTAEPYTVDGTSAVQALENLAPAYLAASRGGGLGIVMQGIVAAGGDVHDFAGSDLVISMTNVLSPTGEYDSTAFGPYSHAEAMLGLMAAGEPVDESAIDVLLGSHTDGDWGGPDSNGIALQVLGPLDRVPPEAIENLRSTQEVDSGWGFGQANPNSSSEVAQGLVAAGENPFSPAWSRVVSGTVTNVADTILAQQGENGCWPNLFGPGDDPFATTDAVMLLVQQPGWSQEPAAAAEGAAPAATDTPEAEATPEPTATAEPTSAPSSTAEPTLPPATEVAAASVPATPLPTPASAPAEAADSSRSTTLIILAVVALLALAGAAVWYSRRGRTQGG